MAPLSDVLVTLQDNALGLTGDSAQVLAFIGTASAGPVGVVTPVGGVTPLKSIFKSGPLVELAGFVLANSGGPAYCVRVNASNAGSSGAVTRTGTGPTPGAAPSGNPLDDYEVQVQILKAGAVGTSTFRVSFDGGDTWSEEYLTAVSVATWAAETGLTITFAAGAYVVGDLYSWTSTGPTYSASDLAAALDALHASPFDFEGVAVAGTVGGADDSAKVTAWVALAAAVASKMQLWFTQFRYAFTLLPVPAVADSALAVPSVSNFVSERVAGPFGDIEVISPVTERQQRRNLVFAVAQRIGQVDVQRSITAVRDGSLKGTKGVYRDERVTPGPSNLRFIAARTFDNATAGYYLTEGATFAAPGSDFGTLEALRTINLACKLARRALLPYLGEDFEINDNGTIAEREAVAIETVVNGQLSQELIANRRRVSAVEIKIARGTNLQTTETINVEVRVRKRPKAKWISVTIGFSNPLLAATAGI